MKDKYIFLADIYAGAAEGGVIQYHKEAANCVDRSWVAARAGPSVRSNPDHWRLKPEPVPVDLLGLMSPNIEGASAEKMLIEAGFTVSVGTDHLEITGLQDGFCMPWEIEL